MARYVYAHSALWVENTAILDNEIQELTNWIRSSGIDTEFDPEEHIYVTDSGDRWIHIPEVTTSQLFAMQMILSSSELYYQNQHVKFDRPPVAQSTTDDHSEQQY